MGATAQWIVVESETRLDRSASAERRCIAGDRLIFAPRGAPAHNLARLQVADLFLDTLPFNAGATASDALWAGVPLVTCLGDSFVGRYAASLLHAAGVPELITSSLEDYEELALQLAADATRLAGLRAKLAANRATCPLFDSTRFTRDLEQLLQGMRANYRSSSFST